MTSMSDECCVSIVTWQGILLIVITEEPRMTDILPTYHLIVEKLKQKQNKTKQQ